MGGKSSTTTTENKPPAWAKPLFELSAKDAASLYKKDKGFNVYEGDRVADMNNTQTDALRGLGNAGGRARDMDYNISQFGQLANQAGGQTFAEQNLQGIAAGNSLMGDPLFQEMLDAQSAKIADQANFAASAAGRYGSGMHTGVLAQNVGDFRRQAVLDNYAQERQRQLQANQMLDQGRFQRMGMEGDFLNQQIAAGNQRLQNILMGDQSALQAGTIQQAQRQAEMDARMQEWKERDMEDWTRLGALQAAASGAAGPYGMSTMTQNQPFNPLGLIGTLGSMFMASDRRLKRDIRRVGEDPRGFGIYEFSYKANPDLRWRGVMADEIEKIAPEAVTDLGSYKAVNYAALGLAMERV